MRLDACQHERKHTAGRIGCQRSVFNKRVGARGKVSIEHVNIDRVARGQSAVRYEQRGGRRAGSNAVAVNELQPRIAGGEREVRAVFKLSVGSDQENTVGAAVQNCGRSRVRRRAACPLEIATAIDTDRTGAGHTHAVNQKSAAIDKRRARIRASGLIFHRSDTELGNRSVRGPLGYG